MPLYLFCLRSAKGGDIHLEPEMFDDDLAARAEAETSALELAADTFGARDFAGCWYEVLDERGRRVATVPVSRHILRQDGHSVVDFGLAGQTVH